MRPLLRTTLLLSLALGLFSGCLTRTKAPVAAGPSPEYQAALAKIVRVPQPHPLLDEGTVPLRALEILATYQDIARRGKYRELLRYHDKLSQTPQKDVHEARLLRREVEHGPALEVLRDLSKNRDPHGVRYDLEFESVQRARTQTRHVTLIEHPDGTVTLAGDGT